MTEAPKPVDERTEASARPGRIAQGVGVVLGGRRTALCGLVAPHSTSSKEAQEVALRNLHPVAAVVDGRYVEVAV